MKKSNKPTVYSRPDSRWWWISWYTPDGRRMQSGRALGLDREQYTREQAQDVVERMIEDEDGSSGEMTVGWFRKETERRCRREGLQESTIKLFNESFDYLDLVFGEDCLITDIQRVDVGRLQDHILGKGCSPDRANIICRHLRAAYNRLLDDEVIDKNPFRKFRPVKKKPSSDPRHLNRDMVYKLFEVIEEKAPEPYRRLIYIYLYTGRRRREPLLIRREDVDLKMRTYRVINIKTKRMEYEEMPPEVVQDFRWFLNWRKHSSLPFAFVKPDQVTKKVKELMREAKLPESLTLHSLRHSFVSLGIKNNQDLKKIQDSCGHTTITTTEKYYSHERSPGTVDIGIKRPRKRNRIKKQ